MKRWIIGLIALLMFGCGGPNFTDATCDPGADCGGPDPSLDGSLAGGGVNHLVSPHVSEQTSSVGGLLSGSVTLVLDEAQPQDVSGISLTLEGPSGAIFTMPSDALTISILDRSALALSFEASLDPSKAPDICSETIRLVARFKIRMADATAASDWLTC